MDANTQASDAFILLLYNRRRRIQHRKWVGRHGAAFADIFCGAYWEHIPTLLEMCRETLNPHIGRGTFNLNIQVVFVSSLFMTFILLPCWFGEPLGDVTL